MIGNLRSKLMHHRFFRRMVIFVKHVKLPFFGGLPLYLLGKFFLFGLVEGFLTSRAAAIAFNIFLAIFPSIIFLFSLIPYVPIEGFQDQLVTEILFAAPKIMDTFIEDTLLDIINNKHSSLLSIGFILALYFATNGINSLLTAFSMSSNVPKENQRSFVSMQLTSISLMVVITVFLILAAVLTIFGALIIEFIFADILHLDVISLLWIEIARWLIIIGFVYFSVAFIYYHGPKQKTKFFSPGASLATLFLILFTMGFGFYVENFATYNKLYGSIGTVMGIMIMIYLNCLALLIGYELNAAIEHGSTHLKLEQFK